MSNLTYAIIPARSGSKGIKNKNMQRVGGATLLQRAILAAQSSHKIDEVFVSSDSQLYLDYSTQLGAKTILRPKELSSDTSSSEDAILHAIDYWKRNDLCPTQICFLQCTSPFVRVEDVTAIITQLSNGSCESCLSVTAFHGFLWSEHGNVLEPRGHDIGFRSRRQDLPTEYLETGAVYGFKTKEFLETKSRFCGRIGYHIVPKSRSIEIDNQDDLRLARATAADIDGESFQAMLPENIQAVIFDFDGVMTDDRAIVDQHGKESVMISRSDGMGISLLKAIGVNCAVLSKERNEVVSRRCEKLKIECAQSIDDKKLAVEQWIDRHGYCSSKVVYMGNDINDLPAFKAVGFRVAPRNAHAKVKFAADLVLQSSGGHGAVRELADLIIESHNN